MVSLSRYLVKSCAGQPLAEARVERQGLEGDRRWMLVRPDGRSVTAREQPRLVLVRPEITPAGLRLSAPDRQPIDVSRPQTGEQSVRVWGSELPARPAGPAAEAWFSDFLGAPVRLVYQHDPASRATNPEYSTAADRVSLADGYPLLLATEESLAALNDWVLEDSGGTEAALDMRRFRPNLVLRGAPAWSEDSWPRVRVGEAYLRVTHPCDRCVMTTVDPDTAVKGREPLRTLARRRRFGKELRFAVNVIPDTVGATIRVGDEVEVLAAEPRGLRETA